MGFITRLIDATLQASWERAREEKRKEVGSILGASTRDNSDNQVPVRTFSIHEALNGQYIEFRRFRYNPSGPDEYEHCVYVVKDDEPLVDAISTVLVMMNGREDAAQ
jgi:hypothetical protein